MANPGQPVIKRGSTGETVKRAQRALRRANWHELVVDGIFGPKTEAAVKAFQRHHDLAVDGIVGPRTWKALPDGSAMPVLRNGSTGRVVRRLQVVLSEGAPGQWKITPRGIDGIFGPKTEASVEAFQRWAEVPVHGIVDDRTWGASLNAAGATLERVVGLEFAARPTPQRAS